MTMKYRITYRNTKGKPGFKDCLATQRDIVVKELERKGYTMIFVNPPHFVK